MRNSDSAGQKVLLELNSIKCLKKIEESRKCHFNHLKKNESISCQIEVDEDNLSSAEKENRKRFATNTILSYLNDSRSRTEKYSAISYILN